MSCTSSILIQCLVALIGDAMGALPDLILDDGALFRLDWPGHGPKAQELDKLHTEDALSPEESIVVSSSANEQYICSLPMSQSGSAHHTIEYFGPSPGDLIKSLHDQRLCTYRIEVYWTYEFCHGQYLLQYHEEKDLRQSTRQEYYLGQYIPESDEHNDDIDYVAKPPKRKVDDQSLAYYTVKYTQGTVCDISGKPRQTTVFYVCDPDGKNQINSFDEISSCEYELVVLTPRLCSHPGFKTSKHKEQSIECYPLNKETPPSPNALAIWEMERKWHERLDLQQKIKVVPSVPRSSLDIDLDSFFKSKPQSTTKKSADPIESVVKKPTPPPFDQSILTSFLSGEYCLHGGGDDWWKYEFCYGKHVLQYHEEPADEAVDSHKITLGTWDKDAHLNWLNIRPHKKPYTVLVGDKSKIVQTNQYYTSGAYCEETGKARTVEVRIKCKESLSSSSAVSLFLLEPRVCEYILGVESQIFCDALQNVDKETGLFKANTQRSEL